MPNTHRRCRRDSTVELSCVGGVYAPVGCRQSWPSLHCNLYVTGAENCKLGHDWRLVRWHRRHDATRLRCRQIVQTRRDCRQLVANSILTADTTQLDSCVGVGGVYWALRVLPSESERCWLAMLTFSPRWRSAGWTVGWNEGGCRFVVVLRLSNSL